MTSPTGSERPASSTPTAEVSSIGVATPTSSTPTRPASVPATPKRRGRPKGSTNKPRPEPAKVPYEGDTGVINPTLLERVTGPEPIKVILQIKPRSFGDGSSEREVDWPAEWRLPQVGESIIIEPGVGGFIQYIAWDLSSRAVTIALR